MPYAALEKEIETLPHAAISEVLDFIRLGLTPKFGQNLN